jgi:RNA polymerase sigma-70 factor (ECF subfamily)
MQFLEWLTQSRHGNVAAQHELFDRWRPLLYLQARKLLGPALTARVDPSDVVQNSLLQAAQDLEKFRGRSQAEWVAWLRRIVAGQAAKARRHHGADRRTPDREEPLPAGGVPDRGHDVAAEVAAAEEAVRLAAAITALPSDLREVVVRRLVDCEPAAAVAQALGASPQAVRTLLVEALRRLRELLGPGDGMEES